MKNSFLGIVFIGSFLVIGACGEEPSSATSSPMGEHRSSERPRPGTTDIGTPALRTVRGKVPSDETDISNEASSRKTCSVDEVRMMGGGYLQVSLINEDCAFETELETESVYALNFYKEKNLKGTMLFRNGDHLEASRSFRLAPGENPVDFGTIFFSPEEIALPEFEPAKVNDWDQDGIFDFFDEDDNNDDLLDDQEQECTLEEQRQESSRCF